MKIFLIDKFRVLLMTIVIASLAVACTEEDTVEYTTSSPLQVGNSYVQIVTPVISFQSGTASYDMAYNAIVGNNVLTKVNVYKTYNDAAGATGLSSAPVLFYSHNVSAGTNQRAVFTETFTYDDLRKDIVLDGSPLPANDLSLAVGAGWSLTFEGVTSDGSKYDLPGTVEIAVLSPFAGIYQIVDVVYWRIGEFRDDVVADNAAIGHDVFIGSVDATTFAHINAWGPFFAEHGAVGQFVFSLADDYETTLDYSLTVLDDPSQLFFSGNDMLTCQEDEATLSNVDCAGSNVLVPDPVGGKHRIYLTYGYYTTGSGPREFYEVLEKKVD